MGMLACLLVYTACDEEDGASSEKFTSFENLHPGYAAFCLQTLIPFHPEAGIVGSSNDAETLSEAQQAQIQGWVEAHKAELSASPFAQAIITCAQANTPTLAP